MASIRIQNLQWLGVVICAACAVLLGGSALYANITDYARASSGVAALTHFETILSLTNALSKERDPAAAAMGAEGDELTAVRGDIRITRQAVDNALVAVKENYAAEMAANAELRRSFDGLDFVLTVSRQAVDTILSKPLERRSAPDVTRAIEAMFSVTDAATVLRARIGRQTMLSVPQITTEIMLWAAASEMREQQGRLSAYVVMMLASNVQQDRRYLIKVNETEIRLRLMRNILHNYTTAYFDSGKLSELLTWIDADYFGRSLTYARMTARLHESDGPIGSVEFTNKYLLGVASTEQVTELLVNQSLAQLQRMREESGTSVLRSAILTGLIVLALLALAVVFRRILFRPLAVVHDQLTAVAHGDLSEPPPRHPIGREIREMLEGVAVLRNQQREKLRLETEQRRMTERLKALSETDTLTGLPNRRALRDFAHSVFEQADTDAHTIGVIIFDVDHFKSVNDTLGHSMGDMVLQKIGKILPPLLRSNDIMARYGGEEFVILLRDTDASRAFAIAERLRLTLSRTQVSRKIGLTVTASFGVALRLPNSPENWDTVVAVADRRLYAAKRGGRNQVCMHDSDIPIAAVG